MLLFLGKNPYSLFRQKKLLLKIQKQQPAIKQITANFVYLIQADDLDLSQQSKLTHIVDVDAKHWSTPNNPFVIISPRFGTVSPWSSKATDILHVCGFCSVKRIERGIIYQFECEQNVKIDLPNILPIIHDKMTETYVVKEHDLENIFKSHMPTPSQLVPVMTRGLTALKEANTKLGLALSEKEISYLNEQFQSLKRDPSFAELMMFAQINSEHCRHKIFNAEWTIAGAAQAKSLFSMIRHTYTCASNDVLSAYKDNSAIIRGHNTHYLLVDPNNSTYQYQQEPGHIVIKVETHNHPTAISPFEGAATGSGGEIRDEGATGIGAKPKAGLTGFSVSNLHIPNMPRPWEQHIGYPKQIASSLEIMLQGPIGAAAFNNEFGRPNICGYFRSFGMLEASSDDEVKFRGYHKPIMIAGGLGHIRPMAIKKSTIPPGAKLVILGGPSMLIGLGGGAASSMFAGGSHEDLDFASVQRSNPEMQRRCQEVITQCFSLGVDNPIIAIHDVGAGGLANALSELVHGSEKGAVFDLRSIPTLDESLSAMEIWCNEAQERYVLAINGENLPLFQKMTERERCPYAVVGIAKDDQEITLNDAKFNESPVDLPLDLLFGEGSKLHCDIKSSPKPIGKALTINFPIAELVERVLQLPTVADKRFLITIADRTVTGLVARDQMVGPWQVAVSDVGVTASSYLGYTGEAMAMGERTPLALIDARASGAMAVGEAITNIIAADIKQLADIKLSANWMAAFNYENEAENLFNAVQEVAMTLCPALGICIPVGKDSLSMQMKWKQEGTRYNVASPLSLIISAFAPVTDIRKTLTPVLSHHFETELMLLDLGFGQNRLGGSCLAQVLNQLGSDAPQVDSPLHLIHFFDAISALRDKNLILAYHDRSDGGLMTTVCEMMFASHLGITLDLTDFSGDAISILFNEELGAVIQYCAKDREFILSCLEQHELIEAAKVIGRLNTEDTLMIKQDGNYIYQSARVHLHRLWSETSYHLQALRDNPDCALQEYNALLDDQNPGLQVNLTFEIASTPPAIIGTKPKVAILREQGVNGHIEMAAAFERVGFTSVDTHMTDILSGRTDLKGFQGLVACGGFSYGDVLGAGRGWANSILYHEKARDTFLTFFNLPSVFVLGVCNGCQMLSNLKELIPGANHWPNFIRNTSEQFEARLSLVRINPSPSLFFGGMEGSVLPIAVSHGEGRAQFTNESDADVAVSEQLISLQYVDNYHKVTESYPSNPNGSPLGIASVTNRDGRFTIMMPHAERVFRNVQFSWRPNDWQQENSPWFQMFVNARRWLA